MSSIQYTIRSIPPNLDTALRKKSKSSGKSLNQVVITTLSKGAGVTQNNKYSDLEWFIGNKSIDDKAFDNASEWLDSLPKDS